MRLHGRIGDRWSWPYQRIRETIFRKAASSNRTKPPTKSRPIQDLPLPLATSESSSATNHNSKAILRITRADYTARKALYLLKLWCTLRDATSEAEAGGFISFTAGLKTCSTLSWDTVKSLIKINCHVKEARNKQRRNRERLLLASQTPGFACVSA